MDVRKVREDVQTDLCTHFSRHGGATVVLKADGNKLRAGRLIRVLLREEEQEVVNNVVVFEVTVPFEHVRVQRHGGHVFHRLLL